MTPPPTPVGGSHRPRRTLLDAIGIRVRINTPFAFLFPALPMVLYACLADPAGTDSGGNKTPAETGAFTIIRGPDGAMIIRAAAQPMADGDDEGFTCQTVLDCFEQCESRCCCRPKDGGFSCTPGECKEDGGDGGDGGGGGGEGGGESWSCDDLRDTLALEYVERRVRGSWPCDKFYLLGPKWIVADVGIEGGGRHGFYGYVNDRLTSKIPAMEAHFGLTAITTSGYRCPVGNSRVPGAGSNSFHIHGGGYDFVVAGPRWTKALKDSIVKWAKANGGDGQFYTDGRNHVHLEWH